MLRNAVASIPTARRLLASQPSLARQVVVAVGGSGAALLRATYSTSSYVESSHSSSFDADTSAIRSGWVGHQHRRRGVCNGTAPSRRPMVNGKPVAFHIRDLKAPVFDNAAQQPTKESKKQYDSNLIVVLDMDECLIHSQFLSSPAVARVYAHQLQQQRRQQSRNNSTCTASVDSFRVTLPDGDLVHVNVRPGLEAFLEAVTKRFETHIFTAALPIYANRVLDRLDPEGTRFAGRWFRDACTYDPLVGRGGGGAYVKNLKRLPFDCLSRVVLVDNNPLSFLANPENGILVNSFYNDPKDNTLPAVLELLNELDEHEDVRPVLGPRFALEENLQQLKDTNRVAA